MRYPLACNIETSVLCFNQLTPLFSTRMFPHSEGWLNFMYMYTFHILDMFGFTEQSDSLKRARGLITADSTKQVIPSSSREGPLELEVLLFFTVLISSFVPDGDIKSWEDGGSLGTIPVPAAPNCGEGLP